MTLTWYFPSKSRFFGTGLFFKSMGKWNYFMEVSFQTGYLLKSSWLSLPLGLRRLFFQKLTFLDFLDMPILEKCEFPYIWWLFQKWFPRPNHYAHKICIEILCKTLVSLLRELSPPPQSIGNPPKIVSCPEYQPEFQMTPTTAAAILPSGQTPSP